MEQYFSQPFPKPGRNVLRDSVLVCIKFPLNHWQHLWDNFIHSTALKVCATFLPVSCTMFRERAKAQQGGRCSRLINFRAEKISLIRNHSVTTKAR